MDIAAGITGTTAGITVIVVAMVGTMVLLQLAEPLLVAH
jgi:hypothetical protein